MNVLLDKLIDRVLSNHKDIDSQLDLLIKLTKKIEKDKFKTGANNE